KRLRPYPINHRIRRQAIDEQVAQRSAETGFPFATVDGRSRRGGQERAVSLDPPRDRVERRVWRQHEAQKLGEVALRSAEGRQLPVEGAQSQRRAVSYRD